MRIQEDVRQSVVFICLPKTSSDGQSGISFVGTAFLVTIPSNAKPGESYLNLVTAKHVAEKTTHSAFLIRVNTKDGFEYIKGEEIKWFYHPTDKSVDVAVAPLMLSPETHEYKTIPVSRFLSDEIMLQKKIGLGDEVYVAGLFAHVSGSKKNQPIVRTGNIAMIPSELIPTELGNIEAYLIEARSIGGLSGSPAFVRETVPIGLGESYFLGLMRGHWEISAELKNDFALNADFFGRVNMGIAIVIPAKKIMEVLNHPELVDLRNKLENK